MATLFAKKPAVKIKDPFAVIPLKPDNVELKRDSRDRIHLRLTMPVSGAKKWLSSHLGYDYTRKVELDENGTLYYSLVDGTHTLRKIVDALTVQTGTEPAEMEKWVVLFTKKLMTMNLILLKVPPSAQLRSKP
jgi:hypothetical protein